LLQAVFRVPEPGDVFRAASGPWDYSLPVVGHLHPAAPHRLDLVHQAPVRQSQAQDTLLQAGNCRDLLPR